VDTSLLNAVTAFFGSSWVSSNLKEIARDRSGRSEVASSNPFFAAIPHSAPPPVRGSVTPILIGAEGPSAIAKGRTDNQAASSREKKRVHIDISKP
jgi:hypothetical protein